MSVAKMAKQGKILIRQHIAHTYPRKEEHKDKH